MWWFSSAVVSLCPALRAETVWTSQRQKMTEDNSNTDDKWETWTDRLTCSRSQLWIRDQTVWSDEAQTLFFCFWSDQTEDVRREKPSVQLVTSAPSCFLMCTRITWILTSDPNPTYWVSTSPHYSEALWWTSSRINQQNEQWSLSVSVSVRRFVWFCCCSSAPDLKWRNELFSTETRSENCD